MEDRHEACDPKITNQWLVNLGMTPTEAENNSLEPYSDEIMAEINSIEERYDIELVSIEHHEKWVNEVTDLTAQVAELRLCLEEVVSVFGDEDVLVTDERIEMWKSILEKTK